ncbi:hypothetical protein B0A55_05418 [Friedmanniomyces simplex]|uniref:MYND-type domain-containing protein n=1 Tax=Friedmanniomyces simplex TaxID=329884 RepID=A0A4U0XDL9_9PEZI|nr:hypothetical protein B0A55_05418 [Friedmanniomyces simplex]
MAATPFADALAALEQFKDTWSPTTTDAEPTCGACDSPTQANGAPLMMCRRCEDKYYCSREGQARDWPNHKAPCKAMKAAQGEVSTELLKTLEPSSPTPPRTSPEYWTGAAMRILPQQDADEIHVPIQEIPRYAYDSPRWVNLPATQSLGFPLRLIANPLGDHTLRNKQAETLGLIPFPDDAKFGETLFPSSAAGAVTLVRADREKLHGFQMAATISYLMYCGKEVRDAKEREQEKGEWLDRKAMAGTLFVPAAFVEAFRALKEFRLAPDGGEVVGRIWREVECPRKPNAMGTAASFPTIDHVCSICGASSDARGGPLLRCTRCRQALAAPHPKGARALTLNMHGLKTTDTAWPALLLTMKPHPQHHGGFGIQIGGTLLKDMDARNGVFQPLLITEAIGFPSAIDPRPSSPNFGRPLIAPGPPCGLLVVRRDGRNLQALHFQAVLDYLHMDLREVINVRRREAVGEKVDREEIAGRLLTPAAFAAAFERMKLKALSEGHTEWEGLEHPVQREQG